MSHTAFQPVRVAVVGLGRFGRLHSLTLAGLTEAEIVGVVARREESVQALQREIPGVPGWTNLDRAVAECEAEAWIVACTTSGHVQVTRKLLQAGKCVLLEKPISENLTEARSLSSLVKPDSSNLMMGHIVLFNSEFRGLRDEARRRGPISYVDSVRHRPAKIVRDFVGENPLHATMVHDLYLVQNLVERAEPSEFGCRYHRTPEGAIDLAAAQLKWAYGPVATFTVSYLAPSGMPPRGFDRTEVFGNGWAARIEPNPRSFELWEDRAEWPMALEIRTDETGPTGMMAEEQRCFCRVVRGLENVPVGATYTDAIQVQHWLDRLDQAARSEIVVH